MAGFSLSRWERAAGVGWVFLTVGIIRTQPGICIIFVDQHAPGGLRSMPWTPPPAPTSLSNHLAIIVGAMRGALAARCAKDRAAAPLILLAWTRLGRLAVRFERLMAKVRAGRLPAAPVVRRRVAAVPRGFRPPGLPQPLQLPRGFGWLLRLVRETAAYSGQVETLLADPEMAALLATSPQARRILRPLCPHAGDPAGAGARSPTPPQAAGRACRRHRRS